MSAQYSCSVYTKHSFCGKKDKTSKNPKADLENAKKVPELKLKLAKIIKQMDEVTHICNERIKANHSQTRHIPEQHMGKWWDTYSNEIKTETQLLGRLTQNLNETNFLIQDYEIPPSRINKLKEQIKEMEKKEKEKEKEKKKESKESKKMLPKTTKILEIPDSWEDL